MSMMSLLLRSGRTTRLMPARWAARTFSLMPPTGSTVPRSVISPVIATSPRTRGHVQVDVRLLEVARDAQVLDVRAHPRHGRARRLFHDVAELAREDERALAHHGRRLDEEDVAARGRPGQARRHARDLGALGRLGVVL